MLVVDMSIAREAAVHRFSEFNRTCVRWIFCVDDNHFHTHKIVVIRIVKILKLHLDFDLAEEMPDCTILPLLF